MKLKTDPLTIIIIGALLLAGSYTGGFFHGKAVTEKEVTIYQDISQYQTQEQWQGQVTVNINNSDVTTNVQVQLDKLTNITVYEVRDGATNTNAGLEGWPRWPEMTNGK